MNRRNFLSMLSALPFVRGLSAPKPETAIPVEPPPEAPVEGWPVEVSIDGRAYRAKSLGLYPEIWEDRTGRYSHMALRGMTGRLDIKVRGLDGWLLPVRIGDRMAVRLLKPEECWWSWACMLVGLTEDVEDGQRVTHMEFIADSTVFRRDSSA